MANPYEMNQQMHSGTLNGVSGKWVPVNQNEAPIDVSTDPNAPSVGADGSYYYAQDVACYNYPSAIEANMHNAIPTPSSIVQLPPIVQPIAMVPYTTQNQPLVQYDPNYRPPVEKTAAPEPVYKPKAYAGISAVVAMLAIAVIVVSCLVNAFNDYTVLGSMTWLIKESGAFDKLIAGDMTVLLAVLVPVLYTVICVFCVIIMINALVKLGKMKPLGKLNVWTLIALLLAIANVVIMFIKKEEFKVQLGAYIIAGILLVMLILPFFINRKVQVLDYVASKQTFVIK